MATTAAGLPDGSVVASSDVAYIKNHPTARSQWRGTNGGYFSNRQVEDVLNLGGVVLRHGREGKS